MSTLNFNASDVEPNLGFEAIPAGKYTAVITDSEMRETKTGNGQYLWLEFEIIGGDHKGRKLWSRLNLVNPNPDAVRMALVGRGIPSEGLRTAGLGSAKPVEGLDPIDSANRRIDFSVIEKVRLTPTPIDTPGPD